MVILTILILPNQEHSISFHLFVSSPIFFISVLEFSEYRSFASLGRFTPSYFILFDAMINGIVSLISLSDTSLLVYRDATDVCILILYHATSCKFMQLNSLMNPSSFLVVFLGFSIYSIMSTENTDRFTSSFPMWIPFFSFSFLITVARTSKTILNKRLFLIEDNKDILIFLQ